MPSSVVLSHRATPPWAVALALGVLAGAGGATPPAAETAADASTRALLTALEERRMPDVVLWVLDGLAADPAAAADLKAEIPLRRGLALAALSRTEADPAAREARCTEALAQIDEFLKPGPRGRPAIDGHTQRGTLLLERGRLRLEQSRRPGADVAALRREALVCFSDAIAALEGRAAADAESTRADTAEDAVLREYRDAKARVAALKPPEDAEGGGRTRVRRDPVAARELERREADVESLQAALVQTRLLVASAYFEKSKAYGDDAPERTAALEASTKRFREIADEYPTLGGGALARCCEGRNLALLGRGTRALEVLAPLVALEDRTPLAVLLRARALTTSLECWRAEGAFDAFDATMRAFVVDERKLLRTVPEPDRLALKFHAAALLAAQAEALPPAAAAQRRTLESTAARLALEVAKADRDLAAEARDLLQSLGRNAVVDTDETFDSLLAAARVAVVTLQQRHADVKRLEAAGQTATEAAAAAAAARDDAFAKLDAALARAEAPAGTAAAAPDEAAVASARSLRAYLLYDAGRYAEAGDLAAIVLERFPNAPGSRQAAMVALSSFQRLAKEADDPAAGAARKRLDAVARSIVRLWPDGKEGSEALAVLVAAAIDARNPRALVELCDGVPPAAAGRPAALARGGAALWREVVERGRAGDASAEAAAWRAKARTYLDEALAAPPTAAVQRVMAAAALARAQIALDDGDAAAAVRTLTAPGTGPWALLDDPRADPAVRAGSFAETALTVALRAFIEAERLDDAGLAMERLEALAGGADATEASARLTALYLEMGRDLQEQLARLAADPTARDRATVILGGFEKFLDGLARRDPRVASQIWVATTYLALGSGTGSTAVVPASQRERYLDRAAEVYGSLLDRPDDADIVRFEPSIRLKLAAIHRTRGAWDASQEQMDRLLADPKRQQSLEVQVQAADILQATAAARASTDPEAAAAAYRDAAAGRTAGPVVLWGWSGIAARVGRQSLAGGDAKAARAREVFFTARLNQASCLLARARLPGPSAEQVADLLGKAETAVTVTRKMYPDLGGPALAGRFESLLKDIQRQRGSAQPRGFAELDEPAAGPAASGVN